MRVLGLIPARGGSKGVPRKNVRLLCGRPLLEYTAAAALSARSLCRVVLSTDDEEIAAVGRLAGLDVPFLRPAVLAQDDTPMLPVVRHAVRYLEELGDTFDAVCVLQPTNPLRTADLIDACADLFQKSGADAVVTTLPVPHEYNPHWVFLKDADGYLRVATGEAEPVTQRQQLPPAFHREGSVYVTRRDVLMRQSSFFGARLIGYEVDLRQSVNIDDPDDWERAERLIEQQRPSNSGASSSATITRKTD